MYIHNSACVRTRVFVCVYKSAASSFRVEWPPKKVFVFFLLILDFYYGSVGLSADSEWERVREKEQWLRTRLMIESEQVDEYVSACVLREMYT